MNRLLKHLQYILYTSILIIIGCNVDEIPPEIASGIRGWFTIDENNIGVNISWDHAEDMDLE